jgi:type II secretory pathway pseudopilin PulG
MQGDNTMAKHWTSRGFTLVDLAAVVLVVTVLVGITLSVAAQPASPINAQRRTASLDNIRLIGQASTLYRMDNADYLPITLTYKRGTDGTWSDGRSGLCGWSFGGKNNDGWWYGHGSFDIFDIEAADRPLNPYVHPEIDFCAPDPPESLPPDDPCRSQQAPIFRDPSDRWTHQRHWPDKTMGVSSYNDVGTSYHMNIKWWSQLSGSFFSKFDQGTNLMRINGNLNPDRLVWLTDQAGDILYYEDEDYVNGYGDVNMSIMGFFDGHADYLTVEYDQLFTEEYDFGFRVLPVP